MLCIKSRNLHSTALIVLVLLTVCNYCSPASNGKSSNHNTRTENIGSKMSKFNEDNIADSHILVEPLLKFTQNLFGTIRSDKKNVLVSPVSVHAALNMVALGAEPDSVTGQELFKGLGYSKLTDDYHQAYKYTIEDYKKISKLGLEAIKKEEAVEDNKRAHRNSGPKPPVVDFYNTLITKHDKLVFENYSKRIANFYNSSVEQIDSSKPETLNKVLDKVNGWAKDAGFEQKILDAGEFSGQFAAMLLSAVRVQAFWFGDFDEHRRKEVFHQFGLKDQPVEGKQLSKSDMSANFVEFCSEDKASAKRHYERAKANSDLADKLNELADLDCRAILIPLQGNVSLTIFEPRSAGQGNELGELANKLFASNSSRLSTALSVLDSTQSEISLDYFCMPKFGFESDIDLRGPLKALGMARIFSRDSSELKHIVQGEPLYVDSAKHQAMIDVNKFGLKAAGVTKIRFYPMMMIHREDPIQIEIENPFIFIIRHNQIPLFIGQLVKL